MAVWEAAGPLAKNQEYRPRAQRGPYLYRAGLLAVLYDAAGSRNIIYNL